jgi:2-keto-4-pentenoate hydratase/2-oxohepta-3-ene-1,7-dioic acid hydratase in catechol pathway
MRFIRYQDDDGVVEYASLAGDGGALRISGDILDGYVVTGERAKVARILAPVAAVNVLGIGRNYRNPGREDGASLPEYPIVFMKATTAVQGSESPIVLPTRLRSDDVRYEGELAVVIGKPCKNVTRDRALDYVLGYTCANDLTAKDWQIRCGQWWRGKSFDTFAPLGPCLVGPDEIADPAALRIRTTLNGVVVQDGFTRDMIFDVPTLIEFLSGETTLLPGTVILTGTPPFVPDLPARSVSLKPGDSVSVEIGGIGTLTNRVEAA